MPDLRQRVASATAAHHIDPNRTDADGHSFCVCGEWADGEMEPGWDDHMADISAAEVAAWLRERAVRPVVTANTSEFLCEDERDALRGYGAALRLLADEIERREASDGD